MKLKPKQKKWMMIAGGSVLAIALTAAIGSQFKRLPKEGEIVLPDREPYQEIILADLPTGADISSVEPETVPAESEDRKELVIHMDSQNTEVLENALPPQTDKEEQKLQEEVTKPEPVPEEVLHDPTRKPDGEVVEGEPEAVEHEEGVRPEEPVVAEGTPQAGDTSGGTIYIPGFGWVENQCGGASGTTAGDMYENGNKIGAMD